MGNVINTNVKALMASNALNKNGRVQQNVMESLSTGKSINRASDNAAGLSIRETMTAQINGLGAAIKNANDAVSQLQTADGALSNLTLKGIVTDTTTNFTFDMHNSSNVLRVVNAPGYENYVNNDNDIITKKYLNNYVLAVGGIAIVDRIFKPSPTDPYNSAAGLTQVLADSTNIQFNFNSGSGLVTKAYFSASGLTLNDINVNQTTITGIGSDNLKLTTLNSTYVEIQKTLELTDQAAMETVVDPGKTKLYSRSDLTTLSQTPGRTGIFFKNTVGAD
jgi:flagellin